MKKLPLWIACTLWCFGTQLSAQTITSVGAEFYGEWSFNHAQAQERPMNSQDPFTLRTVTQNDLQLYNYFRQMPVFIHFMEGDQAIVETPSGEQKNVIPAFDPLPENALQFIEPQPVITEEGDEMYMTTMPYFYNLTLSGNTMSIQCNYFYGSKQEGYMDGILTIYYSK
jgi:hypothetical protein